MHIASVRLRCRSVKLLPDHVQRVQFRREAADGTRHTPMLPGTEREPPAGEEPLPVGGDVWFTFRSKSLAGAFVVGAVYTLRLSRGEEEMPA